MQEADDSSIYNNATNQQSYNNAIPKACPHCTLSCKRKVSCSCHLTETREEGGQMFECSANIFSSLVGLTSPHRPHVSSEPNRLSSVLKTSAGFVY